MARQIKPAENYREKLLKLIPSEIVAAYMVLMGIIPAENPNSAKWWTLIISLVLLILTPFYLKRFERVANNIQVAFCSFSFIVWVYSLGGGGPFVHWNAYDPRIASIVLILWTLAIPLFVSTRPSAK
jgi:hypothetical protein